MSLIFISYRREDSAGYAGRLHESLERRFGKSEVFRDADTLEPGQDFVDAIGARLRHCRACLVVIGREWLDVADTSGRRRLEQENDYVRLEIAAALARPDVLVVPVLVEGMAMPAAEELPEAIRALSRRHAASLRDDTWDADVDRLVRTVRKSIGEGGGFRDVVVGLVRDTRPLVSGKEISYALVSATARRFVNTLRIFANVRITNHDRFPLHFGTNAVRLLADGQATAPVEGPNEVVAPDAMAAADFVFDARAIGPAGHSD